MYFHCHIMILCLYTAAYSEPCQTPETELLTKVSKRSSLDASKASEYVFVIVQIAQFGFLNIHQILQNVKYQQTKKIASVQVVGVVHSMWFCIFGSIHLKCCLFDFRRFLHRC